MIEATSDRREERNGAWKRERERERERERKEERRGID
jgi:hypothetical protein